MKKSTKQSIIWVTVLLATLIVPILFVGAVQAETETYKVPRGLTVVFQDNGCYAVFVTEGATSEQIVNTIAWLLEEGYSPSESGTGYSMYYRVMPRTEAIITTEIAIVISVVAAAIIGCVAFITLRKRC